MKKLNISLHGLLLRAAGVIFLLTMVSLWLVCGLLAKYTSEKQFLGGARSAVFGNIEIREHYAALKEVGDSDIEGVYYGGEFDDMVYELNDSSEVDGNIYDVVMPGVDIPKDPFVRVSPAETDFELYIEIKENDFPVYLKKTAGDGSDSDDESSDGTDESSDGTDESSDETEEYLKAVTYDVDDEWEKVESVSGPNGGDVYRYKDIIKAGSDEQEINILSDKRLTVSQYYDADEYNAIGKGFSMEFYAWMVQKD